MPLPLAVLSGLAMRAALERHVLPAFEQATGLCVHATWDPTTVVLQALADGATPDIVILTDPAIERLAAQGVVDAASITPLADAVLGLAVRRGAPRPDIGTLDAFRRALLQARSVAYSRAGASGIYFETLLDRLRIGDEVRRRATVIPKGFTAEKLVTGEADLAIQQISELMLIDGVDVIGAIPPEVQTATPFTAAALRRAPAPQAAARLLAALAAAPARRAYQDSGLVLR